MFSVVGNNDDVKREVSSREPLTLCQLIPGESTSFNFGRTYVLIHHKYEDLKGFKNRKKNKI